MRRPRLRFSVRWVMVAVAASAVAVWGYLMCGLSQEYSRRATIHGWNVSTCVKALEDKLDYLERTHGDLDHMVKREYDQTSLTEGGLFSRLGPDEVYEKALFAVRSESGSLVRTVKDYKSRRAFLEYSRRMEAKYRKAAWFPWVWVPPDPPSPDVR